MGPQRERASWADIAKGVSIIGVVLLHVTGAFSREICGERNQSLCTPWGEFNALITPLRLPLFFAISGYFARSALARPWRAVVRPRVLNLLYVYALWSLLFLAVLLAVGLKDEDQIVRVLGRMWLGSGYWFLYALAVYFVVTKLTRRLPAPVVFVGGAALALGSPLIWEAVTGSPEITDDRVFRLTFYFAFFAVGARWSPAVEWAAARGRSALGIAVAAAVLVGMEAMYVRTDYAEAARFVVSLAAIGCGAALAMAASRFAGARWFGRVVGQRTLGLYLLHALVAKAALTVILQNHPEVVDVGGAEWIVPPAAAVVVTAISLLGYVALRRVGLSFLFELPGGRSSRSAGDTPVEVLRGR